MPAGAAVNLAMNSVSIKKHSAKLRSSGDLDGAQDFGKPRGHAVDFVGAEHLEIDFVDFIGPGAADRAGDELHIALEQLRVAFDFYVVAVFKRAVIVLAGVPEPSRDRAAAVGELQLQVQVAVAVRAQLLFGSHEDLADLFVVAKLANVTAVGRSGHGRVEGRGLRVEGQSWLDHAILGLRAVRHNRPMALAVVSAILSGAIML